MPAGGVSLDGEVGPDAGLDRAGAAAAGFRSRWAWACPRCAGPGRCAARRAAGVPASRPLTGCRPSRESSQAGDAG